MTLPVTASHAPKPPSGFMPRPVEVSARHTPAFSAELVPGLEGIDPRQWDAMFDGHPDSFELVRLITSCGMDGIEFSTIHIRYGTRLVMLVPVFQARFDVSSVIDGLPGRIARKLSHVLPSLLRPKLLGVGLVEGEWGAVGLDRNLTPDELAEAWRLAMQELRRLAKRSRTKLVVMLDLAHSTLSGVPRDIVERFVPLDTSPCAQVQLPYTKVEDYLAKLSRSTRQGLRRRLRANAHIRIVRTTDPTPYLDRMYELYLATVARSEMKLGVQRRAYFERLCTDVSGAHYVLYFLDDTLLAFNTLIERSDLLVDKYFCMEPEVGRKHSLYFISWVENIRFAISRAIPVYHAGPGSEDTKSHLGCTFVRSETLFRHTNPLIHRCLAFLSSTLAKRSAAKTKARKEADSDQEAAE